MSKQNTTSRKRTKIGIAVGLTLGLLAIPAAFAAGSGGPGWGCHRGELSVEQVRDHMGSVADRALSMVDATDTQRDAVDAILDDAAPRAVDFRQQGRTLHDELRDELSDGEPDRGELEGIRTEGVALFDRATGEALDTLLAVSDVLTAEQRVELAEKLPRHR